MSDNKILGNVYNIQRFSIQDGPGIRTTIFLKGCPLQCHWCSNPESQNSDKELIYRESLCVGCGRCAEACPKGAITLLTGKIGIDRTKCQTCLTCVSSCLHGALNGCGEMFTVNEVFDIVKKDSDFYQTSEGGVTVSGGEPLSQADFVQSLFTACKETAIHTTLDTSGYATRLSLEKVLPLTDLFLYDLKIMDNDLHMRYTGVENTIILENLAYLMEHKRNVIIRIPLIPGITDTEDNIIGIASYVSSIGQAPINVLPYHQLGVSKYKMLSRNYKLNDLSSGTSVEKIKSIIDIFRKYNLSCTVEK